jgi:hypothetical protein
MTLRGNPEHGEGIRSRGKRKAQLRNEEMADRNRGLAPTEDAVGRLGLRRISVAQPPRC